MCRLRILTSMPRGFQEPVFFEAEAEIEKSQRVSRWILSTKRNVPLRLLGKSKTKGSDYEARHRQVAKRIRMSLLRKNSAQRKDE